MTSHAPHRRRRWRPSPDDVFYCAATVTGLLAYVGYGLLLIQIAGGR